MICILSNIIIGIVNGAGESGLVLARGMAAEMLRNGPLALQMAKQAMNAGFDLSLY